MSVDLRMFILLILLMKRTERASRAWCSSCSSCSWSEQNEHREQRLLTQIFYVYITKIVFLDRSFVLNSCNNQYNLFYCLSYLQTLVYSSKKFVTLVYLCSYLVLLIEQSLHPSTHFCSSEKTCFFFVISLTRRSCSLMKCWKAALTDERWFWTRFIARSTRFS